MERNGAAIDSIVGGDWGEDSAIIAVIPAQIIIIIPTNTHTHIATFIFYRTSPICFSSQPPKCFQKNLHLFGFINTGNNHTANDKLNHTVDKPLYTQTKRKRKHCIFIERVRNVGKKSDDDAITDSF